MIEPVDGWDIRMEVLCSIPKNGAARRHDLRDDFGLTDRDLDAIVSFLAERYGVREGPAGLYFDRSMRFSDRRMGERYWRSLYDRKSGSAKK